jgi:transposase-like protein
MVLIAVRCPCCQSDYIIKGGKTETGKQRYRCQSTDCPRRSFVLDPAYKGRRPEIKQQVIDMSLNGSGIRDTARVLKISPTTVINELKKRACARSRQHAPLAHLRARDRGCRDQLCTRPKSTNCGVLLARRRTSGGFGMLLIIVLGRSWRMSLGGGWMTSFWS